MDQGTALRQGLLALYRHRLQGQALPPLDSRPRIEVESQRRNECRALHGRALRLEEGRNGRGRAMSSAVTSSPTPPFDDDLIAEALEKDESFTFDCKRLKDK